MRKYGYIAIGGFFGAVLRYEIKNDHGLLSGSPFPLDTLLINLVGSFLLAALLTAALELWEMDSSLRLGIATGFLGAFTTFSTLCKEIVLLLSEGLYGPALSYGGLSCLLGIAAASLGVGLVRRLGLRGETKLNKTNVGAEEEDAS